MRLSTCLLSFMALVVAPLSAQNVLLSEDFNICTLPPGWEVTIDGNQDAIWYVGTMQNDDALGQSIDGTCCLIIDDDANGDNTPPFVMDVLSPAFNTGLQPTVLLEMDLHYRDWNEADEYFEVYITDGITEQRLARFDETRRNGATLDDHFELKIDLGLYATSPNTRLLFRYNDASGFAWWAAIDNVKVTGIGNGTNVVKETFNGCEKPADWSTEIVTGVDDWKFGTITEGNALGGSSTMDGSCFVFFDDDFLGADTPFSTVRLISPWFDGTSFGRFELNADVILRYYKEKIAIIVQHGDGTEYIARESNGDVGGPYFEDYVHATLDLSPYRAPQMRVIFQYDDGQDFGWWAGLDNIKITGYGAANDICTNAVPLITNDSCRIGENMTALFDGPLPACGNNKSSTGLWYSWQSDFSGAAALYTWSQYNCLVEVFTGDCANPQVLVCNNRDEHGFYGEITYFNAVPNTNYLIRISNLEEGFGKQRGYFCVILQPIANIPGTPYNDLCSNALPLTINGACVESHNYNASMATPLPSLNERARADVWYQFTAPTLPANQVLELQSNANFSDIITLYSGGCNNLQELVGNHHGSKLEIPALTAGQTYYVQVAGNFATVEGLLCPQLVQKSKDAPINDNCISSTLINIGTGCVNGNNAFAAASPIKPSCVVNIDHDVWYRYIAPASGSVNISVDADFQCVVAVWKGTCGNLEQISCKNNPKKCDGYFSIGALNPGSTYYIQLAAQIGITGVNTGEFCINLVDGNQPLEYVPLSLQVLEQCKGIDVAAIQIITAGGKTPYSFQGNENGQYLASGSNYLVVVQDANGCEKSVNGIIPDCETAVVCDIAATFTVTNPSCNNSANGALTPVITGGNSPYTYLWSTGASTMEVNALTGGIYSVTITDVLNCTTVVVGTLVNPSAYALLPTEIVQPSVGQSNGAIYLDVSGGNGQYTYSWSLNGVFFVASEDLTNAPAGAYQLVVTDSQGCTGTFDYTLTELVSTNTALSQVYAEVYPNPTVSQATLAIALPVPQKLYITLTDSKGKALKTWTVDNASETNVPLDLHDLPAAVYQLRILTGKETIVKSITVQ